MKITVTLNNLVNELPYEGPIPNEGDEIIVAGFGNSVGADTPLRVTKKRTKITRYVHRSPNLAGDQQYCEGHIVLDCEIVEPAEK